MLQHLQWGKNVTWFLGVGRNIGSQKFNHNWIQKFNIIEMNQRRWLRVVEEPCQNMFYSKTPLHSPELFSHITQLDCIQHLLTHKGPSRSKKPTSCTVRPLWSPLTHSHTSSVAWIEGPVIVHHTSWGGWTMKDHFCHPFCLILLFFFPHSFCLVSKIISSKVPWH